MEGLPLVDELHADALTRQFLHDAKNLRHGTCEAVEALDHQGSAWLPVTRQEGLKLWPHGVLAGPLVFVNSRQVQPVELPLGVLVNGAESLVADAEAGIAHDVLQGCARADSETQRSTRCLMPSCSDRLCACLSPFFLVFFLTLRNVLLIFIPLHVLSGKEGKEMTNVYSSPSKISTRDRLLQIAEDALKSDGWSVSRVQGAGKSSLRRMTRGGETKIVSIRTTQDRWIAFPRTPDDRSWITLADVDYVVASSVDDRDNPKYGLVHLIPGDEARARFDRAYAARKDAGHVIKIGRGVWVSLYDSESSNPVNLVGAGAGLAHPAIARVPLDASNASVNVQAPDQARLEALPDEVRLQDQGGGTLGPIPAAKRWLARQLGVAEADIKISVSH